MKLKRIEELRIDNDVEQKEICDFLKIKQPQYSRYENGTEPRIGIIIKLAEFYGVSVDYILGLTDIMKPYPKRKVKEIWKKKES